MRCKVEQIYDLSYTGGGKAPVRIITTHGSLIVGAASSIDKEDGLLTITVFDQYGQVHWLADEDVASFELAD